MVVVGFHRSPIVIEVGPVRGPCREQVACMTVNEQSVVDQPVVWKAPGRWAVTAVFFLNGLTLSTYIVRAPSLKDAYHLTDGQFGSTGLLFAVAALACMQFVGPLTARVGARPGVRRRPRSCSSPRRWCRAPRRAAVPGR